MVICRNLVRKVDVRRGKETKRERKNRTEKGSEENASFTTEPLTGGKSAKVSSTWPVGI
jgi:hypothetical protein